MREFSLEEISQYNLVHSLVAPAPDDVSVDPERDEKSIQALTRNFLLGLQADFPATVPTIFRTGDKLYLPREDEGHDAHDEAGGCLLCAGVLDANDDDAACALGATKFSEQLSQKGPHSFQPDDLLTEKLAKGLNLIEAENECVNGEKNGDGCSGEGLCSEGGGGCSSSSKAEEITADDVNKLLCYACRITRMQMSTIPAFLIQEAGRRKRAARMKEEIQDFLL